MNDYYRVNDIESKLSLIVRKPQEGKTFICIKNIVEDIKNIHIVLTMNTLQSGIQFFGRMEEKISPNNIIVFNSNKKTAGKCLHAKEVADIWTHIENNPIKVIICCAHTKRFSSSIPNILKNYPHWFKRQFKIHIDEAHKYIPENRDYVRLYNELDIVESIIGYSATPDGIWTSKKSDILFHKILIRDIEKELQMIRSPYYFGVKCCDFKVFEDEEKLNHDKLIELANISLDIPENSFERANMKEKKKSTWYNECFPFNLGNELLLLSYISILLPKIEISNNSFSYHFIPAYIRKVTHYEIVEIILKNFSTANVITINGNGYELYRMNDLTNTSYQVNSSDKIHKLYTKVTEINTKDTETIEYIKEHKLNLGEPSDMIQLLIKDHKNNPTFITGYQCVGMSVTLINETLGNFDSVIMAHQHYNKDIVYQLCRFLCNYMQWSPENKRQIKKTKFYSLTKEVKEICLGYEEHVENISDNFAGKNVSLCEIKGLEPEKPTEKELKNIDLKSITLSNPDNIWKKFKVYDGNDDDMWNKTFKYYEENTKRKICNKSIPKKVNGYYECSTTSKVYKHSTNDIEKLKKQSWWSTFQLTKDNLSYVRIFVGYDDLNDPNEYTIFVKCVLLEDKEHNKNILYKYYKK